MAALAELKVVPPTITDAGVPIQALLVGTHGEDECCVLIDGDFLRLCHRTPKGWEREPAVLASLHSPKRPFSMATLGTDRVRLDGLDTVGVGTTLDIQDLSHTFPSKPWTFPSAAREGRTGQDARFVVPTRFLDANGESW